MKKKSALNQWRARNRVYLFCFALLAVIVAVLFVAPTFGVSLAMAVPALKVLGAGKLFSPLFFGMAMPTAKPGPGVVNVVPGQTATIDLTIGGTYHSVTLYGTVKDSVIPPALTSIFGDITVLRNGKPVRIHSGQQLDYLNSLDNEELRSNIYGGTGLLTGYVTTGVMPTVVAGTSSGFAVGDLVALAGGTLANFPGARPAVFKVTSAGALAAANLVLAHPGAYVVTPAISAVAPTIIYSAAGVVGTATFAPAATNFGVVQNLALNGLGITFASASAGSGIQSGQGFAFGSGIQAGGDIPAVGDTCTFELGIFFDDYSRSSFQAGEAFAWPTKWPKPAVPNPNLVTNGDGTQQLQSLQIQINVPPIGTNGGTQSLHAITAISEITPELGHLIDSKGMIDTSAGFDVTTGTPFTNIIQWRRVFVPYTAAGDLPVLPPRNAIYQQISFFSQPGDNISNIQVVKDGQVLRNLTKNQNDAMLIRRGINELGIDPNRLDIIMDYSDNPLDMVDVRASNEFTVTPTLIAANAASKTLVQISKVYAPNE